MNLDAAGPVRWSARVLAKACLLALLAGVSAQQPATPGADLRGLERFAGDLARAGRADEWRVLLGVLAQLGLPEKALSSLRTAGEKELARSKRRTDDASRLVKPLREALRDIVAQLARMPAGEPAAQVARQLLLLDAEVEAAHVALGHERAGAGWAIAGETARTERRAALSRAMQQARRLPVVCDASEVGGDDAGGFGVGDGGRLLAQVLGRNVARVRAGALTVVSSRSVAQTKRIVEQALRALAVIEFATKGAVRIPDLQPLRLVMIDSRVTYDDAIELGVKNAWLSPRTGDDARRMSGFYLQDGGLADMAPLEGEATCALLVAMVGHRLGEPAVAAGLLNWVCRACLGSALPSYVWIESAGQAVESKHTSSQAAAAIAERQAMLHLADAGLLGSRMYLRYLAQQREDPPWVDAMLPEFGMVQGVKLLKATFVTEFLIEQGQLTDVIQKLIDGQDGTPAERLARAVGCALPQFENSWRAWLVGLSPGIAQMLQPSAAVLPREVQTTLDALLALRARAFGASSASLDETSPVLFDPELSRGCLAHAEYLVRHPEHAARWPDAHEENPDHPEWSARGAWAGSHAVIAPGVKNGEAALQAWIGTFYHRLPLLDPGLVRIGFAQAGDVAVLDSASMVAPRRESWQVAWPPDGATGIPTRFTPELPNPVPGEDQSRLGYAVTLQLGARTDRGPAEVSMQLFEGRKDGREVPCWSASPQAPSNPELAPRDCFCLIPKALLRGRTNYVVVARFPRENRELVWSFRTE
ncbi:MAG TPA: hypothetical protein VFZ65_14620 [Planctomycetota bacterium]|nr:hypothetical protein [Planctomycetota bacterium]